MRVDIVKLDSTWADVIVLETWPVPAVLIPQEGNCMDIGGALLRVTSVRWLTSTHVQVAVV